MIYGLNSSKSYWQKRDRKMVSRMLGRELESHEVVHHGDSVLILCNSQAQHKLVHQANDALEACGHRDWRQCKYCREYDRPDNLYINAGTVYHRKCHNENMQQRRLYKRVCTGVMV